MYKTIQSTGQQKPPQLELDMSLQKRNREMEKRMQISVLFPPNLESLKEILHFEHYRNDFIYQNPLHPCYFIHRGLQPEPKTFCKYAGTVKGTRWAFSIASSSYRQWIRKLNPNEFLFVAHTCFTRSHTSVGDNCGPIKRVHVIFHSKVIEKLRQDLERQQENTYPLAWFWMRKWKKCTMGFTQS